MDIANAVSRRRRKVWETILAFTCVDVRLCILLLILVMRKGCGLKFVEQEFNIEDCYYYIHRDILTDAWVEFLVYCGNVYTL